MNRIGTLLVIVALAPLVSGPGADAPSADSLGPLGMTARLQSIGAPLQQKLAAALEADDLDAAEIVCREFIEQIPFSPDGYYNLACVMARRGEVDAALEQLRAAAGHGFNNVEHVQSDPDLEALRGDERFAEIVELVRKATGVRPTVTIAPAEVTDGVALVADGNTAIDPRSGLFVPLFQESPAPDREAEITTFEGPAGDKLRQWWSEGTAAGHHGDLYDNRDGDHSDLARKLFPLLNRIEYGPEAKALNLQSGLPTRLVHPGVILGNASVAWTGGPFWRSMPRLATTDQRALALLLHQYTHNQLYIYPSHHDHLPGHNGRRGDAAGGHGDVYYANTPYLLTSQGSSYTDQPFMQALALTMAAFQPEVKQRLIEQNLLAPTLQMIFRRSYRPVATEEDYFTRAAHPVVFRGDDVDAERMVTRAHELTIDAIPPVALLQVQEEDQFVQGRDYFDPVPNERLLDSPAAIARVFRGSARERTLTVSAAASQDPQQRPLTFRWSLLQGREDLVTITPLDDNQSRVQITVAWHDRFPVSPDSDLESNRVDIACFAGAGETWSAPAFLSFYCPDNEARLYDEQGRIESITNNDSYADPFVVNRKDWRDEYQYDARGRLTGWTRYRGDEQQQFTPEGRRILKTDDKGQPLETTAVQYAPVARNENSAPVLQQSDVADE